MRWLAVIAALLGALALGARVVLPSAEEPRALLPDLDQALPHALALERRGDRYLLTFGSAVDNVGAGPLVVEADRSRAAARAMSARQVILGSDRSRARRELGALVRYEEAETHAHWHLHGFASYELRAARDPSRAVRARKVGFCLGDRYEADTRVRLAGEPRAAAWTGECGRGRPRLRALRQGISVGYGEDYAPFLEGQFVDVTDLAPGRYVLVHRANPLRLLVESDYGNNAASLLLELRRRARRGHPTVRLVAGCPDAARCRQG